MKKIQNWLMILLLLPWLVGFTIYGRDLLEVADVLDEDNMFTNSATLPPSQQSAKAYVDNEPHVIQTALATTTNSDDNKFLFFSPGAITLTHVAVACEGTCTTFATITFEDGGEAAITPANAIEDSADGTSKNDVLDYIAISSGGALLDGEIVQINTIADAAPETDTYWFSFKYTVTH